MTPADAADAAPDPQLVPDRIPLEEVYMRLAEELARRSTCRRRSVGAVITSADLTRVLGVGYNGGAKGINNECLGPGGPGDPCTTCIHAETNAVAKAGSAESGKWAFITHSPCVLCATLLINSNVAHVLYRREYRDLGGVSLLHRAGVDARSYDQLAGAFRGPLPQDP
jgi:dCMP deaminase